MSRWTILGGAAVCLSAAAVALWPVWRSWLGRIPPATAIAAPNNGPFQFTDIAAQAGVQFTYFRGETGKYWITETTGGGVALVDFDGDGWLDIVVIDGCRQPPDGTDRQHTSHIFRNHQDGTFVEVTGPAGVAHSGYGQGCFAFDYDNDGFEDLYLTCWGPNALYHNNGDGTYGIPCQPGQPATELWSTGAVPGDFDRDGNLDLLVVNYLDFDYRNVPTCGDPQTGVHSYCGPDSFGPTPSVMLRNMGDGSFQDVSRSAGIVLADGSARPHAKGLGAVAADLDGDGWLDIYVANDLEPNFLFLNRSSSANGLAFDEAGFDKSVATNVDGAPQDSMGIACGDFDGDGLLDLLVTNFYLEGVTLYKNSGAAGFVDVTRTTGLLAPTRRVLGWGTGLFDFDNDGWLDLFFANGHVQPKPDSGVPYAMPAQLFRNVSGAHFDEVSASSGDYFRGRWNGRGAAFGDIDNDGDIDVVVVHHHQPMAILRNDSRNDNRWIRLRLVGRRSDRDAVGARVKVLPSAVPSDPAGECQPIMRELSAAGSYLSSNDPRLLIGLGQKVVVKPLELRWPSGSEQRVSEISSDREIVVYEPP